MTDEPRVAVLGRTTYFDKTYITTLSERPGFRPQIHVQTYRLDPETLDVKPCGRLVLKASTAREVAHAILRAADAAGALVSA